MKKILLFSLTLLSSWSFAQTTATVKQQIATNLPDNNSQKITPTTMRQTLNAIVDFTARKIDNDYIIISPDGKSIKIKPAGTALSAAPKIIELYKEFQSVAETATSFTFKGKTVYAQKFRINVSVPAQVIMASFDSIVSIEGRIVWTDAQGNEQANSIYSVNTASYVDIDNNAKKVTINNYPCDNCTNKRYEVAILYTKN